MEENSPNGNPDRAAGIPECAAVAYWYEHALTLDEDLDYRPGLPADVSVAWADRFCSAITELNRHRARLLGRCIPE